MKTRDLVRTDWPIWLVILLPFVVLAVVWDRLPAELAMHWNASGEIDRYDEKGFSAFLLPLIGLAMYMLVLAVPWLDPKRKTDHDQKAIRAFRFILPLLMTVLFCVLCLYWLGFSFNMENAVFLLVSGLFLVMGNFLGAIKPNYFIGIRTPWTLESPEIWRKTHRLAGKVWVFGALAMILLWFIVPESAYQAVFLAGTLTLVLVPVAYSFSLYLTEKKEASAAAEEEAHQ